MKPTEIARKFAENGYTVFPLYGPKRLKPFGWAKNHVSPDKIDKAIPASNDPTDVDRWDVQVRDKYGSQVTGFGVLGLDCVVIDLDVKDGKDGVSSFKSLLNKYKVPKPRMVTLTKSGGLHCYYSKPAKYQDGFVKTLSNVSVDGVKFEGVDVRGDGGFVVGPTRLVEDFSDKPNGEYWCRGFTRIDDLPTIPEKVIANWLRTVDNADLDSITQMYVPDDFMAQIRRGVVPPVVPKGSRNEAFFVFANVLKSKGIPVTVARQMMLELAKHVEEPETFAQSVDIEDMLTRVFVVRKDNPYDIAVDLLDRGLIQLTDYKPHLHYVILEENPYIQSKSPHDDSTMKVLLKRFEVTVEREKGRSRVVNPMDVVTRIIGDENRADYMGFKPNAGTIFRVHNDPGSRRYVNTYRPIVFAEDAQIGPVWDQFLFLIERLFGPKGSEGYALGMDFMAWLVQRPHIKPSIAPFLLSYNRGVGKSLFFNVITQILGTSKDGFKQGRIVKLDEISGRFFNPTGCIVNLLDEVQFPVHKDMRKESVTFWRHLKNLITAETVSVEVKGGSTYQLPNAAAIMMAGNSGSSFPIEEFDRRLWVVDANAPELQKGMVDDLFDLVRGTKFGHDERTRMIHELRRGLYEHQIASDLSTIRAPMTEAKKDLYLGSLTNTEEWFVQYFENKDNLFAYEAVITKSAFLFVVNAMDPMKMYRFKDDPEVMWRDMKRRGYVRAVKSKSNASLPRQIVVPAVSMDGMAVQTAKKDTMYTTRDHGSFDQVDNKDISQAYYRNLNSIRDFKTRVRKNSESNIVDGGIYGESEETQEAEKDV